MVSPDTPRLTVDLAALAANHARLVKAAEGAEVAPVVKADAYGLGMAEVAPRLWACGARRFFVARVEEGVSLRALLGPGRPALIYVFEGATAATAPDLAAHDLIPLLNSLEQVEAWRTQAGRRDGARLPAALHFDTGLNRLGLDETDVRALAADPGRTAGLAVELVASHLACADEPDHPLNALQADRFAALAALFPQARTSLAASAGLFLGARFRGQVVRPGIGLYGGGVGRHGLHPVATLEAPIVQVRDVAPGGSVGYGAGFVAERPTRVAVIAIGYADGVLRAQGGRGYGWFAGARRPLIGRISMDLTAVDVTGCEARPGERIELFGANLPLDEAAANAGTIAYELLSRVSPRVVRQYREARP